MMVERGREAALGRLYPIGAITKGLKGEELAEMADTLDAGAVGVSDDGYCVMNSAVMRRALQYARTFDLPVIQHCEDHDLTEGAQMNEGAVSTRLGLRGWPRVAEDLIVARDILLAADAGARYHVAHMSSGASAAMVREAKSRGLKVSAEVTPHHLLMTDSALLGYDTHCKMNPPLRTAEDRDAMVAALADGTVDCIATDHAPHSVLEKDCEFSQASLGVNGLETAVASLLALVREGKLSATRLIEAMTISAVRLFPEMDGGTLSVGQRADIAVIDPNAKWRLDAQSMYSKSHNTPWLDTELQGRIVLTLAGGTIIHRRGI
jgi:dihydroorotase